MLFDTLTDSSFLSKIIRNLKGRIFKAIKPSADFVSSRQPWDIPEACLLRLLNRFYSGSSLRVAIIGAYHGYELERLIDTAAVSYIDLFEPDPDTFEMLEKRINSLSIYRKNVAINALNMAVCATSENEFVDFHRSSVPGTGSLISVSTGLINKDYKAHELEVIKVSCTSLDHHSQSLGIKYDILWIDVQGAEMMILKGGYLSLQSAMYVYIEVSTLEPLCEGGCIFDEVYILMKNSGFSLIQLNTDVNGTGNALFQNAINSLSSKVHA